MRELTSYKHKKTFGKKLAALVLLAITGIGAFASLGDGRKKSDNGTSFLTKNSTKGSFSLRSHYSYRGSQVINPQPERRVIRLNTVVTVQRGNTTYVIPLKKNVLLGNVKIDIGNRQFQRN
jgi:hypothetical protein